MSTPETDDPLPSDKAWRKTYRTTAIKNAQRSGVAVLISVTLLLLSLWNAARFQGYSSAAAVFALLGFTGCLVALFQVYITRYPKLPREVAALGSATIVALVILVTMSVLMVMDAVRFRQEITIAGAVALTIVPVCAYWTWRLYRSSTA